MNINLVGGDPYGGSSTIDQSFLWRPFKGSRNHETEIKGLYHIGASTHPGAGLGGGSGFLLAQRLVMDQKVPEKRQRISTLGQIGLQQFAPYLMNRIMGRYNATLREDFRKQGLTIPQVRTLAVLSVMRRRHGQRPLGLYRHRAVDAQPHARRTGGAGSGAARAGRNRQPRAQGVPDR